MKGNSLVERVYNPLIQGWGHEDIKLKYEYENKFASEVKTYKMSKEELEKYLSKYNKYKNK